MLNQTIIKLKLPTKYIPIRLIRDRIYNISYLANFCEREFYELEIKQNNLSFSVSASKVNVVFIKKNYETERVLIPLIVLQNVFFKQKTIETIRN